MDVLNVSVIYKSNHCSLCICVYFIYFLHLGDHGCSRRDGVLTRLCVPLQDWTGGRLLGHGGRECRIQRGSDLQQDCPGREWAGAADGDTIRGVMIYNLSCQAHIMFNIFSAK